MKLLTLICLLLMVSGCGQNEVFLPSQYDKKYISFGYGGGITGAVTQFYILEDGRSYKRISADSLSFIGKIEKDMAQQQFQGFDKWGMDEMSINDPGNRYFFLESNQMESRLTWGGNHEEPPKILSTFHANLTQLIKQLSQTEK